MEHSRRLLDNGAAHLPSYQDATKRPDWLELVALHVPIREYARLCLVSQRFYHQFAPRLWNDPFTSARMLNRDNDLEWVHRFMKRTACVRAATLALVRSVDLRGVVAGTSEFALYSYNATASEAFRRLKSAFPRLMCILLDGHPDIVPEALLGSGASATPGTDPPLLLSIPQCQAKLPISFFESPYLRNLVYLDVSDLPGSLGNAALQQLTINPINLPNLRILKAQGREMDCSTAILLFKTFQQQLWSVNLSRNKLSDGIFGTMHHFASPPESLRGSNFAVEGGLIYPPGEGSASFGEFCFVNESDWSATFSHSHRHLVDAPVYSRDPQEGFRGNNNVRLDGRARIRSDSADTVKAILSGSPPEHVHDLDICRGHRGITHLYLNDNNFSAAALARMIRVSPGQLQHLECDSMSFKVHEAARFPLLPGKARLSGILGSAHVFRPVMSSNLQVLRIHHSLVTQLLSLEVENLPAMANLWMAETWLLPRAELAYPEAFVPDMNPRLRSLVLTHIPRYSTGPLIEKLVNFLKLASIQEREIQDIRTTNRHGPVTLLGLRHIRFEFQPDPREALIDGSVDEDGLDTAKVMDLSKEFSFFGGSGWAPSPSGTTKPLTAVERHAVVNGPRNVPEPRDKKESGRPEHVSNTETGPEAESEYRTCSWTWNSTEITVPVWIGSRYNHNQHHHHHTPAVKEYMRLLRSDPRLCANPEPATPNHVAAGVPPGSYIFSAAWEAMLAPPSPTTAATTTTARSIRKPTRAELRGMRDVIAVIKAYRVQTRAAYGAARKAASAKGEEVLLGGPHFHWTGTLEVLVADTMGYYQQSKFWR